MQIHVMLISVKHCSIWFEGNRCGVQDFGSEHATFVNKFSYTREFEAFQKSLFERVVREAAGIVPKPPDPSAGTRIRSAADAMN